VFLKIKGIGKIQDSTIELQGITVIAGENNTGKSTFGKVLYCMFNAFYNAEAAIHDERIQSVRSAFRNILVRLSRRFKIDRKVIEDILSTNEVRKTIEEVMTANDIKLDEKAITILQDDIERFISISNDDIQKMLVTRNFRYEFAEKVNHLNRQDSLGVVSMVIKGEKIEITIKTDECCEFVDNVGLLHDAIYIDAPFIMDDIANSYTDIFGFYNTISHRDNLLDRLSKNAANTTALEEVVIKKKINNLLSTLKSVVEGEFKEDKNDLMFAEKGIENPVPLLSVSTGIKSFLVIKRLLELGEIKEHGVLILDEPEIHLHPDWQLRFAEILVLLQIEFNLTILLTTHSPYFLHALEIYSNKHGIKGQTKFYMAENSGDVSGVYDITDNIDAVYKQMAKPFQKLEDLIYED
jgi:predicted ATPase